MDECMAINTTAGGDGGMLWIGSANPSLSSDATYPGPTYVYYDSKGGPIRYRYTLKDGFQLQNTSFSESFGSVFSDMRGKIYRLSPSRNGEEYASVEAKGVFNYLQCLLPNGTVAHEAPLSKPTTMGDPYGVYAGYGYVAFRDLSDVWQVHVCVHACIHARMWAHTRACACARTGSNCHHHHECSCVHTHGHTLTCTRTCARTHAHTHARARANAGDRAEQLCGHRDSGEPRQKSGTVLTDAVQEEHALAGRCTGAQWLGVLHRVSMWQRQFLSQGHPGRPRGDSILAEICISSVPSTFRRLQQYGHVHRHLHGHMWRHVSRHLHGHMWRHVPPLWTHVHGHALRYAYRHAYGLAYRHGYRRVC